MAAQPPAQIVDAATFAAVFQVSRETIERLEVYEALLRAWQKRINLVASTSLNDIWHRHFADSAQLARLIPPEVSTMVDLGSGAGFPGLVLALILGDRSSRPTSMFSRTGQRPQSPGMPYRIALIESDGRKAAFLREAARQTGATVEILATRIENPQTQAKVGCVDLVTARALAPLAKLLPMAAPYFAAGSAGLFLKGRGVQAEIDGARTKFAFGVELVASVTATDGRIAVIRDLQIRKGG